MITIVSHASRLILQFLGTGTQVYCLQKAGLWCNTELFPCCLLRHRTGLRECFYLLSGRPMVSDQLLSPVASYLHGTGRCGHLALGSGRRGATVTPREQPGSPESKPRAAQLGWAGGQMDCAVAGRLGPAGPRVATGTRGCLSRPVGGGAGGWTVCGLGEGSEGACRVVASSPAAPPPAVRSLGPGAVARASTCNLWAALYLHHLPYPQFP